MLIRNTVKRIEIPHEPGDWMEFRPLLRGELEEAQLVYQRKYADSLRAVGLDILQALDTPDPTPKDDKPESAEKPEPTFEQLAARHDPDVVLKYALSAWSYPEELSPVTIAQLDPETVKWAVAEALRPSYRAAAERDARFPDAAPGA